MRGQVELYFDYGSPEEKLVSKDTNVIVDGASELITDIMTYPTPSLSGSVLLSSILDASNYTVQALSFGKAAPNFSKHAHIYPSSLSNSSTVFSFETSGPRFVVVPYTNTSQDHYPTSAYPGANYLPSYPGPTDTLLETNSFPMASHALSSIFPLLGVDWGQNLNMIPYRDSITISSLSDISFPVAALSGSMEVDGTFTSSLGASAVWLGCYPAGSATASHVTDGASGILLSSWEGITGINDIPGHIISSGIVSGLINTVSSMDIFGFMGQHYCASGNIAPVGTDTLSGLVISGSPDQNGSSITYMSTIGSGDVQCANLYGGITSIGLWALDICKSMENSEALPPFNFNPIDNPRKYKLFSKKVFTENICSILGSDDFNTGHRELTIIWRLFF